MDRIVSSFRALGLVSPLNDKIIAYGLQKMSTLLIDLCFSLLLSTLMGNLWIGLLFEVTYSSLRIYSGGYHAPNEKYCKYLSWGCTIGCLFTIFYLPLKSWSLITLFGIAGIVVLTLAPIESTNKPLTNGEQEKFKKKSRTIFFADFICFLIFSLAGIQICAKTICISLVLVALGLLMEKNTQNQKGPELC